MTKREADWAKQHDWCSTVHKMNNGMYKVAARCDRSTMGIRYFESYDELRAWAGY